MRGLCVDCVGEWQRRAMSFELREASFERQNLNPHTWLLFLIFETRVWNPYLAVTRTARRP